MSAQISQTKAERLIQIEALLLAHPEGLSQSEIAKRLGVHRSTILRNLAYISAPIYQDGNRYFIDRDAYLVNVRFSLHEA
ncbi:MAG TPA: helix-turn-helix domain-containing protein, partial [Anaerolineaceae bacterium]|nr:helix-turn-helix domain-containing protein [Anaerolineaceae bacterium]